MLSQKKSDQIKFNQIKYARPEICQEMSRSEGLLDRISKKLLNVMNVEGAKNILRAQQEVFFSMDLKFEPKLPNKS